MTIAEAAKILGISRQRVYQKLVEGKREDFMHGDLVYSDYTSKDGRVFGTLCDGKWSIRKVVAHIDGTSD